jgi:uncharacterized protein (DUF58 family)
LTLFHGDIEHYIPARKGQKHALRVVREVLTHEAEAAGKTVLEKPSSFADWILPGRRMKRQKVAEQTNISRAVEFLLKVMRRRAVCFVVSDFFDDDYLRTLQMAAAKHDVIAVLVTDPRELSMPPVGLSALVDAETGGTVEIDASSRSFREQYAENASRRLSDLETKFRRAKIDFIHIDAAGDIVQPVAKFFRMRERRRR